MSDLELMGELGFAAMVIWILAALRQAWDRKARKDVELIPPAPANGDMLGAPLFYRALRAWKRRTGRCWGART